jgi:hypothetical protein
MVLKKVWQENDAIVLRNIFMLLEKLGFPFCSNI